MHGSRIAYYILGEGVIQEPEFLSGGRGGAAAGIAGAPPSFRFGRMFPRPAQRMTSREWFELNEGLVKLGLRMNERPPAPVGFSEIPSGYTYLGQFIAHEVTFDDIQDTPSVEPDPKSLRSPSLDLDSLYGEGPNDAKSRPLYNDNDPALMKLGWTGTFGGKAYENDLPRNENDKFKALIADSRNDENLTVAQTQVAFIKFHNKVVEKLRAQGHSAADLFDCARMQVTRHFQWLVLHDFLPRLVDEDVIACVKEHGCRWFRVSEPDDLYMPLEFSAAAFRIGHTMVREKYNWNWYHAEGGLGVNEGASLTQLFEQTASNGGGHFKGLPGDWLIDWRRFYEFPEGSKYRIDKSRINMAARLDTHLDLQTGFDPGKLPPEKQSISVRNLLRGFALGLPTGEEVAARMGEDALTYEELASGSTYADLLGSPAFMGKTPLWYYILKEAEVKRGGSRLGRVGGRILAETLIGLIRNSRYSILSSPGWYPIYTDRGVPGTDSAKFGMVDLLTFIVPDAAGLPNDINPYKEP